MNNDIRLKRFCQFWGILVVFFTANLGGVLWSGVIHGKKEILEHVLIGLLIMSLALLSVMVKWGLSLGDEIYKKVNGKKKHHESK